MGTLKPKSMRTETTAVERIKQWSMAAGFRGLLLSLFLVTTGFCPLYHCRLSAHACSFNIPYQHLDLEFQSVCRGREEFTRIQTKRRRERRPGGNGTQGTA